MVRKTYFKLPSVREVKQDRVRVEANEDFVQGVLGLEDGQYLAIDARLVPSGFRDARRYQHHGKVTWVEPFMEKGKIYSSLDHVLRRTMDTMWVPAFGLGKRPFFDSNVPVVLPFVNILEGAKIFSYSHKDIPFLSPMGVLTFDRAKNVKREGAEVYVTVPSRTKGQERYTLRFSHVPVVDNEYATDIALNTNAEVNSKDQEHFVRFEGDFSPLRSSKRRLVSGLEAAAMYAVIEHYAAQGNVVPYKMSLVPVPSQKMVDLYKTLEHRAVVKDWRSGRERLLSMTEKSRVIGDLVSVLGFDTTFRPTGKLKDYDWEIAGAIDG
jgi:hypothetical protein